MLPRPRSIVRTRVVRTTLVVTTLIATTLSCSGSTESPNAPASSGNVTHATPPAPPPAQSGSLVIAPNPMVVTQGDTVHVGATLVRSDGTSIPMITAWASSDSQIVAVDSKAGQLFAGRVGQATITASVDSPSMAAEASVVVLARPNPRPDDALIVQQFYMTEYQYPSQPGHWYYAPQLRVVAAPGRTADIGLLALSVPGLPDPIPPFACNAHITTAARDLNGEVYGDWTMSVDSPGSRATGADGTAKVTYTDDAGVTRTITITGPIVSGSLPTTYSGGSNGGACFHGYGSGGP